MAIPEIISATIKINHRVEGAIEASLFVISLKSPGLKVINLSALANLDEEARIIKLQKWNAAHRFVTVIELVDKIYIEANHKYTEGLKNPQNLIILGKEGEPKSIIAQKEGVQKTVEVKALTDTESEEFFESIKHIFKTTVTSPVKDSEDKKVPASSRSPASASIPLMNKGPGSLAAQQVFTNFSLGFSKIVDKILEKWRDSNEADREQQKRVEQRRRIEQDELKRDIVNDGIKSDLVKAEEIKKKTIAATNGTPIAVTTAPPAA